VVQPRAEKMNTLNEKKNKNPSLNFKILRKIKVNSIRDCVFFKVLMFLGGRDCDYSPWVRPPPQMPRYSTVSDSNFAG
jgi:hypothetical protein